MTAATIRTVVRGLALTVALGAAYVGVHLFAAALFAWMGL